jgi:hypothetical protein
VRLYAFCRTILNCYAENSSLLMGTKGRANITQTWIEGETKWKYTGPRTYENPGANPYQIEQNVLFQSIRKGSPFNSGDYMARSTLIGVMGQISCYTGSEVRWAEISASDFSYPPRPEDVRSGMEPPVQPGPDGTYPVFVPGLTKLL